MYGTYVQPSLYEALLALNARTFHKADKGSLDLTSRWLLYRDIIYWEMRFLNFICPSRSWGQGDDHAVNAEYHIYPGILPCTCEESVLLCGRQVVFLAGLKELRSSQDNFIMCWALSAGGRRLVLFQYNELGITTGASHCGSLSWSYAGHFVSAVSCRSIATTILNADSSSAADALHMLTILCSI